MAERQEELRMSAQERDRLKVLHEVQKRHITQVQAGKELGLQRALGASAAETSTGQGRRSGSAAAARAALQPALAGEDQAAGRGAVPAAEAGAAVARLRTHAGGGRTGRGAWHRGEPGDPAAVADRGEAVASAGARVAGIWERGGHAGANCCNGTPASTTGGKDAGRGCI